MAFLALFKYPAARFVAVLSSIWNSQCSLSGSSTDIELPPVRYKTQRYFPSFEIQSISGQQVTFVKGLNTTFGEFDQQELMSLSFITLQYGCRHPVT